MKFRGWRIPMVFQGGRITLPLTVVSLLPIPDLATQDFYPRGIPAPVQTKAEERATRGKRCRALGSLGCARDKFARDKFRPRRYI